MLLHIAVLLPFIGALLIPFLYRSIKGIHPGYFALIIPISSFALFITSKLSGINNYSVPWMSHIGLDFDFRMDGLAFLFVMLITVIGCLVIFYSIHYLNSNEALGNFYTYLLLFMGAMLGVVLSDNVLSLYLFWELTSISSFLLIAFWHHKEKSLQGALKSMLITVFGGLMLLGGLVCLIAATGTYSIHEMMSQSNLMNSPLFIVAMIFILLAAFTKSAQFPFHIWLPDAMEAPTPVSAYLHSATMVKAGVYLVARMTPLFAVNQFWIYSVTFIGAITLCWASFNAVKQNDLKGVLAYSTVSQLGLMMTLLGVGGISLHYKHDEIFYMAAAACVFHIFNHASFKGSLFMITGILDHETGTRDLRRLSGLMTVMPLTFTLATIGSLSMAGVPPFNGFLSKEMFITSMYDASGNTLFQPIFGWLLLGLIIIGSIFTFVYSIKWIKDVFFGKQSDDLHKQPHEAPIGLLLSPIIMISVVIITGLIPNILVPIITDGAEAILNKNIHHIHISHWHGINAPLLTTLAIFIIGGLLIATYQKWHSVYRLQPQWLTFNHLYNRTLDGSERYSYMANNSIISLGNRAHVGFIFLTLAMMTTLFLLKSPIDFGHWDLAEIRIYEVLMVIIIVIATYMVIIAQSRLFSIIMLSAIGYSIGLFFVFYNAPDLALTQLTIETISTALFLMCFFHLPKLSRYHETFKFKMTNAVIAFMVGFSVTVIALIAYGHRYYRSINDYYIDNVYSLANGKNMVNVILVDFRGFDTLFESTVLGIAGIGIYTLIKLRYRKDDSYE